MKVRLDLFDGSTFCKGAGYLKLTMWFFINAIIIKNTMNPFVGIKVFFLRLFGSKIGKGLVLKPGANVKFPWKLRIGNNCWIGENVWIDNLDNVYIGNNVCISQGAMLLTGNHDYSKVSFDYRNGPISIEDGVWIGANSVVCPGITCKSHSILTVGSIATKSLEDYGIYQGNPALMLRMRHIISKV